MDSKTEKQYDIKIQYPKKLKDRKTLQRNKANINWKFWAYEENNSFKRKKSVKVAQQRLLNSLGASGW